MSSAKQFVEKTVAAQPVVVFAKSTCPHCAKTRALLSELEVTFELVNLDQREDGAAIQNALEEITGQRTVPNIFIGGKSVGGNSDLQAMHQADDLLPLLNLNCAI